MAVAEIEVEGGIEAGPLIAHLSAQAVPGAADRRRQAMAPLAWVSAVHLWTAGAFVRPLPDLEGFGHGATGD